MKLPPFRAVGLGVFVVANLINLLLVVMFTARGRKTEKLERVTGLVIVAMAVPLAAASLLGALF